jgi:L-ascorbate metabolism protein UlaG (beta-lactamase superfamily)
MKSKVFLLGIFGNQLIFMKIRWLGNSCLEIIDSKQILIDPNFLQEPEISPEVILITHEHDDHCNPSQIASASKIAEIYAPQTTLDKFALEGTAVIPGRKIGDIKVLPSYCYGSDESVSYYFNGLLHNGDSAKYPRVDNVKAIFTACFPDYYDDYIEAFKILRPEVVIPFHYDVEEDIENAQGLIERMSRENINGKLLSVGESITIY